MVEHISHLLTEAASWLARPHAFVAVLLYVALWLIFDRASLSWHEIARWRPYDAVHPAIRT
jgi:low affinity Fe/Cu permease